MYRFFIAALSIAACLLTVISCSKDDSNNEDPYKKYYEEGMDYLKKNAEREGVVVTESGLQYEVLREGDGKSPSAIDKVRCHYEGRFINGRVFDSSYKAGDPIDFRLDGVIAGWTEGLQYMKEGAKYRFTIPFYLGYGPYGYATIPPYSTLIFDVELIKVL